jgi:hypothetical protein
MSGDHGGGHPELSAPRAPAFGIFAIVIVQGWGGIERIANIERIDVDDTNRAALILHDRADIGAASRAEQVVGDAETEPIAARLAPEFDRAGNVAQGACAMATAEGAATAADAHRFGFLVRGEGDLDRCAVAGTRIGGHGGG